MTVRITIQLLFLLLVSGIASAYNLTGKITDENGEPLSFVNVRVKGTSKGCSSNEKGLYAIPLEAGSYEIVFSYIGYTQQVHPVKIENKNVALNITMKKTILTLRDVIIDGSGEDPAYRIIREAMKKRKDHLEQIEGYTCDVYIKGLQRLREMPEKIFGFKREQILGDQMIGLDSMGRGILYLSESVSKFNFKQPNKIKEEMISSKVSGDNHAFSYNQASDLLFNFYENSTELGGMSDRGFMSPVSSTAMLYYKYKLEGCFIENNRLISKIQVIPRRKNDPVYRGYIYIVEDTWNIHSVDLFLTKDAQIDFVDTLKIQQIQAPVEKDVWMPVSNNYSFDFGFMGVKGEGYFIGFQNNYIINPDFANNYFGAEIMKVLDDANKKDSVYWDSTRPVPLTEEEKDDYHKKDSIALITNTRAYKDSMDRKRNKFGFGKILLTGYNYENTFKKQSFNVNSLLGGIDYNTVQGFVKYLGIGYSKWYENYKRYSVGGNIGYGFGNKHIYGSLRTSLYLKPQSFTSLGFSAGNTTSEFDPEQPVFGPVNAVYTLFFERNFTKIYEKKFVRVHGGTELLNGFYGRTNIRLEERIPLHNTISYTVKDYPNIEFTSNNPLLPDTDIAAFPTNIALLAEFEFTFRFKQRYYTRPNQKIIIGSRYPDLKVNYSKGMGDVNFDLVKAGLAQVIDLGMFGEFKYNLSTGYFFNTKRMYFMDYKHFKGNQTIFLNNVDASFDYDYNDNRVAGFNLMPYYAYSTDSYFIEAHAEHHFNGWIINKIPLLRKTRFKEVGGIHYLSNDKINQYIEATVGIERIGIPGVIPGFLRIDFITGYSSGRKLTSGFRIGFNM